MILAASQLSIVTLTDSLWESRHFPYICKNKSHVIVTSSALQGKWATLAQDNHMAETMSLVFSFRAGFSGSSSRGKNIVINLLVASFMMKGAEPEINVGTNLITTTNDRRR